MAKTVGKIAKYEIPTSPHWEFDQVAKCTRTFSGPYADLLAAVPVRGAAMDGTTAYMLVTTSDLQKQPGNMATLTVHLAGTTTEVAGASALRITEELDWVSLDKPLKRHPRFQSGGDCAITDAGWELVDSWMSAGNRKLAELVAPTEEGTARLQAYGQLVMRGVDSYRIYAPRIIVTSIFNQEPPTPSAGNIFVNGAPSTSGGHAVVMDLPKLNNTTDYVWSKTAAKKTQNADRTWQSTEEFTGMEEIEWFLYPVRASGDIELPSSGGKKVADAYS